jgi:hypothetical protein
MQNRHIWQQTLPTFSHHNTLYTIHNARNFHRLWDNEAKQEFTEVKIDLKHIVRAKIYQSTFGFGGLKNVAAHYMIWFVYNDWWTEKEIIFSIEARSLRGKEYSLLRWLTPGGYSIIYIRWTPSDVLSLRKNTRHDPLKWYDLNLSANKVQDLFVYFSHRTNMISHKKIWYHLRFYNCLTDLHKWLSIVSRKIPRISSRTIRSKGYITYLQKKWLLA